VRNSVKRQAQREIRIPTSKLETMIKASVAHAALNRRVTAVENEIVR
jgi:hypothetical protein